MSRQRPFLQLILLILLAILLLGVLIWGNLRFVQANPGGTDFLVHWVGTRAFILEGLSPYSDETALQIQTMVYGRAALPGEHELRVAYPLYSILIFLPFALISDYNTARAIWMAVLECGLILMVFLSLNLVRWRPKPIVLLFLLLFSLFWYHGLRPVILGNVVVLVALAFIGVMLALRNGHDELAGVLLALTTIKPQVAVVFIVFISMWCLINKRAKTVIWFFITLGLLSALAFLFIPDWILQNLREVLRYPGYNPPGTLSAALEDLLPQAGRRIGNALSAITALILLIEWFLAMRRATQGFIWTACLSLVASLWIGLQTDPGNFIVAFPAILLVFSVWIERWRVVGIGAVFLSMILLFVGLWAIFLNSVEYVYQPVQSPIMFLPLPLVLLILLYWVRWWAINPPATWFDQFSQSVIR